MPLKGSRVGFGLRALGGKEHLYHFVQFKGASRRKPARIHRTTYFAVFGEVACSRQTRDLGPESLGDGTLSIILLINCTCHDLSLNFIPLNGQDGRIPGEGEGTASTFGTKHSLHFRLCFETKEKAAISDHTSTLSAAPSGALSTSMQHQSSAPASKHHGKHRCKHHRTKEKAPISDPVPVPYKKVCCKKVCCENVCCKNVCCMKVCYMCCKEVCCKNVCCKKVCCMKVCCMKV